MNQSAQPCDPEYDFGLRRRQHRAWITWGDVGSRLIKSQPESLGAFPCLVCLSIAVQKFMKKHPQVDRELSLIKDCVTKEDLQAQEEAPIVAQPIRDKI